MLKLLVVEDDLILGDAYRAKFEGEYEVRVAVDGESGLTQANSWLPDIILLDIYLSNNIGGVGVLAEIKNNIKTQDIPVLVITNLPFMEKKVLDLGADKCLMKSDVDLSKIEKYLIEILKKRGK